MLVWALAITCSDAVPKTYLLYVYFGKYTHFNLYKVDGLQMQDAPLPTSKLHCIYPCSPAYASKVTPSPFSFQSRITTTHLDYIGQYQHLKRGFWTTRCTTLGAISYSTISSKVLVNHLQLCVGLERILTPLTWNDSFVQGDVLIVLLLMHSWSDGSLAGCMIADTLKWKSPRFARPISGVLA